VRPPLLCLLDTSLWRLWRRCERPRFSSRQKALSLSRVPQAELSALVARLCVAPESERALVASNDCAPALRDFLAHRGPEARRLSALLLLGAWHQRVQLLLSLGLRRSLRDPADAPLLRQAGSALSTDALAALLDGAGLGRELGEAMCLAPQREDLQRPVADALGHALRASTLTEAAMAAVHRCDEAPVTATAWLSALRRARAETLAVQEEEKLHPLDAATIAALCRHAVRVAPDVRDAWHALQPSLCFSAPALCGVARPASARLLAALNALPDAQRREEHAALLRQGVEEALSRQEGAEADCAAPSGATVDEAQLAAMALRLCDRPVMWLAAAAEGHSLHGCAAALALASSPSLAGSVAGAATLRRRSGSHAEGARLAGAVWESLARCAAACERPSSDEAAAARASAADVSVLADLAVALLRSLGAGPAGASLVTRLARDARFAGARAAAGRARTGCASHVAAALVAAANRVSAAVATAATAAPRGEADLGGWLAVGAVTHPKATCERALACVAAHAPLAPFLAAALGGVPALTRGGAPASPLVRALGESCARGSSSVSSSSDGRQEDNPLSPHGADPSRGLAALVRSMVAAGALDGAMVLRCAALPALRADGGATPQLTLGLRLAAAALIAAPCEPQRRTTGGGGGGGSGGGMSALKLGARPATLLPALLLSLAALAASRGDAEQDEQARVDFGLPWVTRMEAQELLDTLVRALDAPAGMDGCHLSGAQAATLRGAVAGGCLTWEAALALAPLLRHRSPPASEDEDATLVAPSLRGHQPGAAGSWCAARCAAAATDVLRLARGSAAGCGALCSACCGDGGATACGLPADDARRVAARELASALCEAPEAPVRLGLLAALCRTLPSCAPVEASRLVVAALPALLGRLAHHRQPQPHRALAASVDLAARAAWVALAVPHAAGMHASAAPPAARALAAAGAAALSSLASAHERARLARTFLCALSPAIHAAATAAAGGGGGAAEASLAAAALAAVHAMLAVSATETSARAWLGELVEGWPPRAREAVRAALMRVTQV